MKNLIMIVIGILIGISMTNAYFAWDNPTSSYSGSMSVLTKHGNLSLGKTTLIYHKNNNVFDKTELNALAKMCKDSVVLYVVLP